MDSVKYYRKGWRRQPGNALPKRRSSSRWTIHSNCSLQPRFGAPRLFTLWFSPRAVATSGAPAIITVNFSGTDNLSGFAHILVGFRSPSGNFIHNDIVRLSGLATQFSGSTFLTFPQFVETGVWVFADVRLIDYAGKCRPLWPKCIAALIINVVSTFSDPDKIVTKKSIKLIRPPVFFVGLSAVGRRRCGFRFRGRG